MGYKYQPPGKLLEDPARPMHGVFQEYLALHFDTTGPQWLDLVGAHPTSIAGMGGGLNVAWPAVSDGTKTFNSPQDLWSLEVWTAILEERNAWIHSASYADWSQPDPDWGKYAVELSFDKWKHPFKPIPSNVLEWDWQNQRVSDELNAAFMLAHALNRWDLLDVWYPLVHEIMGRWDRPWEAYGGPFAKPPKLRTTPAWAGYPSSWGAVRKSWLAGFEDGSHLNAFFKLENERTEAGLPTPPLAPYIAYVPFWWIHKTSWKKGHPSLGIGSAAIYPTGLKHANSWSVVQPIGHPDDHVDAIAALVMTMLQGAVAAAAVAGIASSMWQGLGSPLGELGLELTEGAFGGALEAGLAGGDIGEGLLDGLAAGALDSAGDLAGELGAGDTLQLAADVAAGNETLEDLGMSLLSSFSDGLGWVDDAVGSASGFLDELAGIGDSVAAIGDAFSPGFGGFPGVPAPGSDYPSAPPINPDDGGGYLPTTDLSPVLIEEIESSGSSSGAPVLLALLALAIWS